AAAGLGPPLMTCVSDCPWSVWGNTQQTAARARIARRIVRSIGRLDAADGDLVGRPLLFPGNQNIAFEGLHPHAGAAVAIRASHGSRAATAPGGPNRSLGFDGKVDADASPEGIRFDFETGLFGKDEPDISRMRFEIVPAALGER